MYSHLSLDHLANTCPTCITSEIITRVPITWLLRINRIATADFQSLETPLIIK